MSYLPLLLKAAAAGQLGVALLNLRIPRLLGWEREVQRLPLLMREVFQVHVWFISITLTIFAVVTWRFAPEMAINPACRWLAGGISIFWGIRTIIQFAYYSGSHWWGKAKETAIHFVLLAAYGALAVVYALACMGGWKG